MLSLHTESELDTILNLLDPEGGGNLTYNVRTPDDQSWNGKIAQVRIGESASASDRWKPMYCKYHAGSGTMFHFYDASSSDDSNNYSPISLLQSSDSYSIGDLIWVTIGDGVLRNDSWPASDSYIGKPIYFNAGSAYISYTTQISYGNHVKQLGTLIFIDSGSVFDISFRYPEIIV